MTRTLKATVARPAAECFAAFCDARRIPEWVPGIDRADVIRLDPHGLPAEVRFQSGSRHYTLLYAYDVTQLRVAWIPGEGAQQAVRGFASFAAVDGASCEVSYALDPAPGRAAPPDRALSEAQQVLTSFRTWVEGT